MTIEQRPTRLSELRATKERLLAEARDLVRDSDDLDGPQAERFDVVESELDALKGELDGLRNAPAGSPTSRRARTR